MKVSKALRGYENSIPSKIKIKRVNVEPNGYYDIEIKTWEGETFYGVVGDKLILELCKRYTPYINHKKYEQKFKV